MVRWHLYLLAFILMYPAGGPGYWGNPAALGGMLSICPHG
jgi:hypothetical protein